MSSPFYEICRLRSRIVELEAEIERLRAMLQPIAELDDPCSAGGTR